MTIIHPVISCLAVPILMKAEKMTLDPTKQLYTNTSTLCDQTKVYRVILELTLMNLLALPCVIYSHLKGNISVCSLSQACLHEPVQQSDRHTNTP